MSRNLHRALRAAQQLSDTLMQAVWAAGREDSSWKPRWDRTRYDVHVEALASNLVDKLPAPVHPRKPGGYCRHTLVSSLLDNGLHAPVLDLDGVGAKLIPSTTEGNFHLYLEGIELPWREYKRFLRACARAGLITEGYLKYSLGRGQTTVRRPGLQKTPEELGRRAVYDQLTGTMRVPSPELHYHNHLDVSFVDDDDDCPF